MKHDDLIQFGDAAVRQALANMLVILNGSGEILTHGSGDELIFSPNLECDRARSALVFDDEDSANKVIDEILVPQENDEYHVFRFTSIDDGSGDKPKTSVEYEFIDDSDEDENEEKKD